MYFYLGAFLALSTLGRLVLPAPVPETQPTLDIKDMEVMRSPEFQDAAESALSLITKILDEIPAVHESMIHFPTLSLDKSDLSELQHLKETLDLPEPSPLQPLSVKCNLESSLSSMVEGLKLHKTLLKVIAELPHFKSKKPGDLPYDLRDALMHLHKMQHLIKAVKTPEKVSESQLKEDLTRKVKNEFQSQGAAHLTLLQLRDFAKDVSRSLQCEKNISEQEN